MDYLQYNIKGSILVIVPTLFRGSDSKSFKTQGNLLNVSCYEIKVSVTYFKITLAWNKKKLYKEEMSRQQGQTRPK